MFNIGLKTTGVLQDVLYKCKISGSIVADPGTGDQIIMAYSRYTGELLGSAVWDAATKTYELFIPTNADEKTYLTRIDNNGQYFAETYDRLSLCTVNNVYGSEYSDMQNNAYTSKWMNCAKGSFSFPFNIIHENLKKVDGTFSFINNYKEGTFLVNGNYYPLGRKANGVLYSDDGIIVCDAEKSQNFTINEIVNSLNEDPFNDGSLIAAYPMIYDGKDVKRLKNSESNKTYRYVRAGYYGAFDTPKFDQFVVPIVINRNSVTTICFDLVLESSYNNSWSIVLYIPNICQLYVYSNLLYWELLNPNGVSQTSHTITLPSKVSVAIVINQSGSDKLYINGALVGTKTIVAPVKVNQEYFNFPMTRSSGGAQLITLTGAYIFNRELTLLEIQTVFSTGNQKTLPIPQNINHVKESNGAIVTGQIPHNFYENANFLKDGILGNAVGSPTWDLTHYGITEKSEHITFNGSTGILYRNNTKDTSAIDVMIKFSPVAVTAQCIWKIGDNTNGIAIGINGSAQVTLYARNAGVLTSISFTSTVAANIWYSVVLTGGYFKIYSVDDVLIESISNTLTIGTYAGVESIGGAYNGSPITGTAGNSGYFSGSISKLLLADIDTYGDYVVDSENSLSVFYNDSELPVELVKWDMINNTAVLWTKVPEISTSGTEITIKQISTVKSGTPGSAAANDVWNNDFVAVYHMNNNSKLIDSTAGKLHGNLVGIDASNFTDHLSGSKLVLNGTDEYVQVNLPVISGTQRLSVFSIFNPNTIANNDTLIDVALTDTADSEVQLSMQFNSDSKLNAYIADSSENIIGSLISDTVTASTDHFVTLNYTGKNELNGMSLIVDGTVADSDNSTGKRVSDSDAVFNIGKDAYSANYYDGSISELFIRNKPMSAEFEKALRLSITDQLGTYTIQEGDTGSVTYWTPNDIETELWLDASDSITITKGTGVAQWNDKSGNLRHVIQLVADNQPTYIAEESCIDFDGINDCFSETPLLATNNFCVFIVAFPESTHEIDAQSTSGIAGVTGQKYVLYPHNVNSNSVVGWGVSLGSNGVSAYEHGSSYIPSISSVAVNLIGNNIIQCEVINKQTELYANATKINSGLVSIKDTVNCQFSIGGNVYGYFNGKISEIIVISGTLGQSNRQMVEGYLAHKWNISLPLDHPYTDKAPTIDTSIDQYWDDIILGLPMEGVNNTAVFADVKYNPVYKFGDVKLSNTQLIFGATSAYFDGTGDYLNVGLPSFDLGTGDFTVECWFMLTQVGSYKTICFSNNFIIRFGDSGFNYLLQVGIDSSSLSKVYSCNISQTNALNSWKHIAFVRSGGYVSIFVNGIKQNFTTGSNPSTFPNTSILDNTLFTNNYINIGPDFTGYIKDFIIIKGVARYTANFTVGNKSHFADMVSDPYWNNTVFLSNFNGTNNSTAFLDIIGNNLTVGGNAKMSNVQTKFGTTSAYFDGTGDYLSIPTSTNFKFGLADFTIECWIYPKSIDYIPVFSILESILSNNNRFQIGYWSGVWNIYEQRGVGDVSMEIKGTASVVNTDKWIHIAVVRNGSLFTLYENGVSILTGNYGNSLLDINGTVYLCGATRVSNAARYLNGYIDDLRITKGAARYTENFTPPEQFTQFSLPDDLSLSFDIASNTVSSNIKDVPIMLRLSDSSGLDATDVTPIFNSIKTAKTKPYGINPINSEFGFLNSGLSNFNTPYITLEKNQIGISNKAFKFTGNVNSIINITNCIYRSYLMYNLTFSMWIKLETLQSSSTEILLFGTTGVSEFQLTHRSNGEIVYRHTSSGMVVGYVRHNKWNHIMLTRNYETKTINAYINGILTYTYVYTTNPAISTNLIYIGGSTTAASGCTISDIQLFDRVLESDMLQNIYRGTSSHFKGLSTSILHQDVPILMGENLTSINVSDSGSVFYAVSQDKRTYYIYNDTWKAIASDNPIVHGFIGESNPYYFDADSSEWVYSRTTMEETISLAMEYADNRMSKAVLNTINDFTGIYDSSIGTINIAVSFNADGTSKQSFNGVVINNKQYWISESFTLSDFCDTVSSSKVITHLDVPDSVTNYVAATKIYCKLDNGASWVECVDGAIPNIPVGLNTSGRSAVFKVVWDISVWINPKDFSLEVIIK